MIYKFKLTDQILMEFLILTKAIKKNQAEKS